MMINLLHLVAAKTRNGRVTGGLYRVSNQFLLQLQLHLANVEIDHRMPPAIDAEKKAAVVAILSDPKNKKKYRQIQEETGVCQSTIKSIARECKTRDPKSVHDETSALRIIDEVPDQDWMNICRDESYDNKLCSTNLHPDFPLQEVPRKILEEHTVSGYTTDEAQRVKRLYKEGSMKFHGLLMYPAVSNPIEIESHDQFQEVLKRNQEDFKPIFQVVQEKVHPQLLKYLKSQPEPAAAASVPAEQPVIPEVEIPVVEQTKIQVVDSDSDKKKKRKVAVEATKPWIRGGDEKRLHLVMEIWKELVIQRIKQGMTYAKALKSQMSQDQKRIESFEGTIASNALCDTPVTRNLQSAAGSDPVESHEIRAKHLEAKLKATKDKLDNAKLDLQKTEENCAQAEQDLKLTKEMITICSQDYKRIIKHSPYAGIVESELNDKKSLSVVLAKWRAKAQGLHADSKYQGGSILQSTGRKQYLVVLLNGFQAMRILKRLNLFRSELLEIIKQRLLKSFSAETVQGSFNESRIWNFLCSRTFEKELQGPIQPALWPVEKDAFLLVDNLTPHGGAPNDGLDAFRIHWYAYRRALDERVNETDEDPDITIDLLLEYRSLCEYAQRKAMQNSAPIFWFPA